MTCQVRFTDNDLHRTHFRSDWHRYNLKRKVAQLPVVSYEAFEERRVAHETEAKIAEKKVVNDYCVACRKNFKNPKAYENHIQSKKHQEMVLKFEKQPPVKHVNKSDDEDMEDEDDLEIEEVDSDEWEDDPIENSDCLFCPHHSSSLEKNLSHMTIKHSFFLPDPEYITDLEGLIDYLGAKVGQGHMCLWCNEKGKRFSSVYAAQQHMLDKGHCKMLHEGDSLLEYDEWYDYTTSYPDQDQADDEVDLNTLDDSGYELVLPSGTKIGHRSLQRYYKQSLNPNRALVLVDKRRHNLLTTYKSLGWTGSHGQAAVTKARDLSFMRRIQNKQSLSLGMRGNNQKHFKDRNGMCM